MSTVTPSTIPTVPTLDGSGVSSGSNLTSTGASGSSASSASTPSSASPNTAVLPASLTLPLGFQRLSFETLGIRMPNSPGDTAALLAEVSEQLDKIMDEAGQARREQIANALRSLIGNVGGMAAGIAEHREAYNRLRLQRDAKTGSANAAIAEREELRNERDAKVSERNGRSEQVSSLNGQIAQIESQIAAVAASGGDTSGLVAARDDMVQQRDQVQALVNTLNGEISQLEGRIQALTTQINQGNDEATSLGEQMAVEKSAYERLEAQQAIAMNVFAQYALGIAGRESLATLVDFNWNEDIDRLFDNLADTLKQLQATATEQARSQSAAGDLANRSTSESNSSASGSSNGNSSNSLRADGAVADGAAASSNPITSAVTNSQPLKAPVAASNPTPLPPSSPTAVQQSGVEQAEERKLTSEALALVSALAHIVATLTGLEALPEGAAASSEDSLRLHLAI